MSVGPSIIPLSALTAGAAPEELERSRALLLQAEVILGVDARSQKRFLVYGRELCDRIASGKESRAFKVAYVEFNAQSDELQTLCGLIEQLKGKHDYVGPGS
jgi:hypothetical protein